MTKLMKMGSAILCSMLLLVALSSRHVSELFGYAKATADTTVSKMEDSVPTEIRDQKLRNDIDQARSEIIDRRVKLNLAESEIRRMQEEIEELESVSSRRETILAEAYPVLESAANDRLTEVTFAGEQWLPGQLGVEVDNMLMQQERDEKQLKIRRDALERLLQSVQQGTEAIAEMENKLLEAENEFQALMVRRDQAENETQLLDLVAAAGRQSGSAAGLISENLDDMRGDVESLEARNEARRVTVPAGDRKDSRLTQTFNRLERLKALHKKHQSSGVTGVEVVDIQTDSSTGQPIE